MTASISASENSRCCQRYEGAFQSSKSDGFEDSLYRGMAPAEEPNEEAEAPAAEENFFRKSSNEALISFGARGWTAGLGVAGVSFVGSHTAGRCRVDGARRKARRHCDDSGSAPANLGRSPVRQHKAENESSAVHYLRDDRTPSSTTLAQQWQGKRLTESRSSRNVACRRSKSLTNNKPPPMSSHRAVHASCTLDCYVATMCFLGVSACVLDVGRRCGGVGAVFGNDSAAPRSTFLLSLPSPMSARVSSLRQNNSQLGNDLFPRNLMRGWRARTAEANIVAGCFGRQRRGDKIGR